MALKSFLNKLTEPKIKKQDVMLIYLDVTLEANVSDIPIGILSIATVLKQDGFAVKCFTYKDILAVKAEMRRTFFAHQAPKVVGFSVDSDNIQLTIKFAEKMKKWLPTTTIIVGGPLATLDKEKMLDHKVFDYSIVGEGEYSVRDFCRAVVRKEGEVKNVPGVYYRENGEVHLTAPAKIIENLDELPQLDYSISNNVANNTYLSGRGCPFNCTFCTKITPDGYRYFSSERVVSDIIKIAQYGRSYIIIGDDTFIANPKRVQEICKRLVEEKEKRKLKFSLYCEGRADIINKHPELIDCLKEAGMIRMQIGIESGLDDILQAYNKRITTKDIEKCIDILYSKKPIIICGNLILSAPFDTYERFRKSLDYMKHLINKAPGFLEVYFPHLCPYPKTHIGDNPDQYGLEVIDREWLTGVTTAMVACLPKGLKEEDIIKMRMEAFKEIEDTYDNIVLKMPYDEILFHLERHLYGGRSVYYHRLLLKRPILDVYFRCKQIKNGCRLNEIINKPDFTEAYPARVLNSPNYTEDGKDFILEVSTEEKVIITDELEKQLYLYSFGKLNIDEVADQMMRFMPDKTKNEIIQNFMIPTYKKWENFYHLFFVY